MAVKHTNPGADNFAVQTFVQYLWNEGRLDRRDRGQSDRRLIFFWVDRFIFNSDKLGPVWNVKEEVKCVDCGKITRGYRLVKTKKYDKTESVPEFRCETCSIKKSQELKDKGKI